VRISNCSTCLLLMFIRIFFMIVLLLYWGYIVSFTKLISIYHRWIHPSSSFIFPSHNSLNSFNRSHFSIFVHVYIIFPLHSVTYTFPYIPSPPTGTNPQAGLTFMFPIFEKWHFCMFKIATQRILLWHFHVYVYYNLICFLPCISLFSIIVTFLWWLQQV
jgi:hypothetical protein